MSLRLARRCHFPAPTSARTSSFSSVSRVKRIAPRHSVRRSQWKSSCVGSSNSALSVIGDCSSTSSPNEACLGCFEELSLSYELHNFTDTTTRRYRGAYPGWRVDHTVSLKHYGRDSPSNMAWQTVEHAKSKD